MGLGYFCRRDAIVNSRCFSFCYGGARNRDVTWQEYIFDSGVRFWQIAPLDVTFIRFVYISCAFRYLKLYFKKMDVVPVHWNSRCTTNKISGNIFFCFYSFGILIWIVLWRYSSSCPGAPADPRITKLKF